MQWSRLFPVAGLAVVIVGERSSHRAGVFGPAMAEGVVPREQLDYREALKLGMAPTLPEVDGLEPIMLEETFKLIGDGVRTGFCSRRPPDNRRVS